MTTTANPLWRGLRLAFGGLDLVALIVIAADAHGDPTFSYANYFSYFTILSNILATVMLIYGGVADPQSTGWQFARGAVTLYMVITGVVYNTLLTKVDVNTNGWDNRVVHLVVPLAVLADWLLAPPARRIPIRDALWWLAFPLVYGVYSLVRGPIVDWYPYPFIDPRPHGYARMTISVVIVFAGMAVLAVLVAWLAGLTRRRTQTPSSALS